MKAKKKIRIRNMDKNGFMYYIEHFFRQCSNYNLTNLRKGKTINLPNTGVIYDNYDYF